MMENSVSYSMNKSIVIILSLCVILLTDPCASFAQSATGAPPDTSSLQKKITFHIERQALSSALVAFSLQSGITVAMTETELSPTTTNALSGTYTVEDGLKALLAGTDLEFTSTGTSTLVVRKKHASQNTAPHPRVTDASQDRETENAVEEIVVTAQKRIENLQDVPVPVTAIRAETLTENNQVRLQDYFSTIPGFNVTPSAQSHQHLSIRGITTGPDINPTVGVVVDDVPYGSSTVLTGGSAIPDIDPSDLARIEVLRGPQGTLYGASSMGGLLKFVTADPSTAGYSGRIEAGVDGVHNGAEPGYNFRASANVPISDILAINASGFTRRDPGYVDNPILGIRGINWAKISGGHFAALWRPSDVLSLKISALYQVNRGGGQNDADPSLGDLKQNFIPGIGPYYRTVQAYSATLNAKLGAVDLTSISGYNVNDYHDTSDYGATSPGLSQLTQQLFGVSGLAVFNDIYAKKFSQEIRLSGPIGENFEWLAGAFYTHEISQFHSNAYAEDPVTGAHLVDTLIGRDPVTYTEYAEFFNLTYHFTDQFDVQIGGRESQIRQTYQQTEAGPYVPVFYNVSPPYITPLARASNDEFTYLLTPRYKLSPDFMVYVRLASGYRAGGPNITISAGTPAQYNPDKTENYEIGVKGDFLEHKLSVDASIYYIDWKNIQTSLTDPKAAAPFPYTGNAGKAKSEGVELSVESRPLTGLTVAAWVAYNNAVLTQAFPANSASYGVPGDRLPYSSRFSGYLSLEQDFPLWGDAIGFVGGAVRYSGDKVGLFTGSPLRQTLPAYAAGDLHAGVRYDAWTANVFVTNVADTRGEISGGLGAFPPSTFYYIQPRTVGLNVVRTF